MEGYEKQQLREILRTFLLVALVSGFLIFLCVAEGNYGALALAIGVIAVVLFRWIDGANLHYQENQRDNP